MSVIACRDKFAAGYSQYALGKCCRVNNRSENS
jgi:hypothetical protein